MVKHRFIKMTRKRIFGLIFLCSIVPVFIYVHNAELRNSSSYSKAFQFLDVSLKKPGYPIRQLHDSPELEKKSNRRTLVVILAYMHTGSTYLGSIFQQHENSFYEYEKLRSLMYSTHANKTIYFLNGTERTLTKHPDPNNAHHNVEPKLGAEAMEYMVTCQHDKLDIATLANHYFSLTAEVNKHTKDFYRCQERLFGKSQRLRTRDAFHYVDNMMLHNIPRSKRIIKQCLPIIKQRCNSSSIVVEKDIRITMKMVEILLKNLPEVKIIHLVRDPRAMLDSQARKGDSGANDPAVLKERIKYLCKQMKDDLQLAKTLKVEYPGQIRTVRYEDMTQSQESEIGAIFKFANIPFTAADKQYTQAHDRNNKTVTTARNPRAGIESIDKQEQTRSSYKSRNILSLPKYVLQRQSSTRVIQRERGSRPQTRNRVYTKPTKKMSWREHITESNLETLNTHCSEVYEMLGYVKFDSRSEVLNKTKNHYIPISLN